MKSLCVFFIAALVFVSCSSDNSTNPKNNEKTLAIQKMADSLWGDYISRNSIPSGAGVAFAIDFKGQKYFFKSRFDAAVNEHYHFRIASNTKVFTAAAIILLQQRGLLNINDKITDNMPGKAEPYLANTPECNIPFKNKITIKLLLNHRAGVYDISNDDIPDTVSKEYAGKNYFSYIMNKEGIDYTFPLDESIKVVAETGLFYFEPGADYHYSNTGYQILAKIIENVSGKTYSEFIRQELFIPNNLTKTTSPWRGDDVIPPPPYLSGFVYSGGELNDYTETNHSSNVAEGNIISTLSDMNNWIKRLFTGLAGVSSHNIALMKDYSDNPEKQYGLGVKYYNNMGYGHSGATIGYLSYSVYNPDKDVAISLVCNLWDMSNNMQSLINQLMLLEKICIEAVSEISK